MAKYCANCGTNLPQGAQFCPGCGQSAARTPHEPEQRTATHRPGGGRLLIGLGVLVAVLAVGLIAIFAYPLLTGEDDAGEAEPETADFTLTSTLTGHSGGVRSVAFSPDGQLLASGGADSTVKLWNPQSGEEIQILEGHSNVVASVAFSLDGSLLASSDSETIKLWDPQTGEELQTLEEYSGPAYFVAFSPDGSLLASGDFEDGTIKLWDPQSGEELQTLRTPPQIISTAVC